MQRQPYAPRLKPTSRRQHRLPLEISNMQDAEAGSPSASLTRATNLALGAAAGAGTTTTATTRGQHHQEQNIDENDPLHLQARAAAPLSVFRERSRNDEEGDLLVDEFLVGNEDKGPQFRARLQLDRDLRAGLQVHDDDSKAETPNQHSSCKRAESH
ncbi:unnamed protein product, partial [Amoebophrya sp. A25]|eukprot:GSA25T00009242001.1